MFNVMSAVTYNNDAGRSPYLVLTCCRADSRSGGDTYKHIDWIWIQIVYLSE